MPLRNGHTACRKPALALMPNLLPVSTGISSGFGVQPGAWASGREKTHLGLAGKLIGMTLAGYEVPIKAAPSLRPSTEQGRENTMKHSWIQGELTHQLLSWAKQTQFWKISLIYCQSNRSRVMRNKTES